MTGFIYPMEGSWTWNGDSVFGLYSLDYYDYAGSGIVHLAGAAAALAGVLVLGPRKGKYKADGSVNALPGANLPLATLGTFNPVVGLVRFQRRFYSEGWWYRCC